MDTSNNSGMSSSQRMMSVDALRGFDMCCIVGGGKVIRELLKYVGAPAGLQALIYHADWEGFTFWDLIFPLFLFIIGVVLPYSLKKRLAQGAIKRDLYIHIFKRTAMLCLWGVIIGGLLEFKGLDQIHYVGVLQRLAMGYLFASLILMNTTVRGQAIFAGTILVVYWALMTFIPVPGFGAGDFSKYGNLAGRIDLAILPGRITFDYGDPEGILSTIPAISTALLGVLAGQWLMRNDRTQNRKVLGLLVAGIVCLAAGYLWSLQFPVIKKIWTSSYVLVAGGWSLLFLALFYWVVDVLQYRKWAFFFVVIGANPILIYILTYIVDLNEIAGYFINGFLNLPFIGGFRPVLFAFGVLMLEWLLLYFLYKKKIYIKL
ncbi:MAG TPA: DUF5009 domain-containing protein [bacterium]|nr:DUF5009 domain-containing protein [bacterium]